MRRTAPSSDPPLDALNDGPVGVGNKMSVGLFDYLCGVTQEGGDHIERNAVLGQP